MLRRATFRFTLDEWHRGVSVAIGHPHWDGYEPVSVSAEDEAGEFVDVTVWFRRPAGVGEARPQGFCHKAGCPALLDDFALCQCAMGEARPAEPPPQDQVSALGQKASEMRAHAERRLARPTGVVSRQEAIYELARDVVALTEELAGLREQLDAARQALEPFLARPRWLSIGSHHNTAEIRVPTATFHAARAALGVVGGRPL
jgi:hypothetical protein